MHALVEGSRRKSIPLKPIVLVVALALPGGSAWAASMGDVVSTRATESIGDQYGRDSLYAFSRDDTRFKSGQNSASPSWLSRGVDTPGTQTVGNAASLPLHDPAYIADLLRSEERRVGKECRAW